MLPDGGVDPHGGTHYSRYDRVRVEATYKDIVDKEKGLRREAQKQNGPPSYTMNLANACMSGGLTRVKHSHTRLEIIAEKVEKNSPRTRSSLEGLDESGFETTALRHLDKTPTQKWDLPVTRQQEIGWIIANGMTYKTLRERNKSKTYPKFDPNDVTAIAKAKGGTLTHSMSAPGLPSHALPPHLPTGQPPKELSELNNRRFYRPKVFCPITKYADTYTSMMGCNPFNQSLAGR
mmetsp:Transcript_14114/g.29546  ORF Transcript_14114/g.29546 Transcript_14114/m.29546 type:complete len:234 (-) Transcript_14114:99-800(-)